MSVLACERRNCDNIMCDVLIANHYVCGNCLVEFEFKCLGSANVHRESEITDKLLAFLQTPKNNEPYSNDLVTFEEYLNQRRTNVS